METKNENLIPAICKISVAPIADVSSLAPSTNRSYLILVFENGKTWQPVYSTPGSAEFTEKPKETDAGEIIEQSVKFMFPGEDPANRADLDQLIRRPLIAKLDYNNGGSKIVGSLDIPAKLSQLLQVGGKSSGSQLEITCMANSRACWLNI